MSEKPLILIGADMRRDALARPGTRIRVDLEERGLVLVMLYRLPKMQLSLIRPDDWPPTGEIRLVRTAFNFIPEYARLERDRRRVGQVVYHIVRLIWDEAVQLSLLPADKSSAGNNNYQE